MTNGNTYIGEFIDHEQTRIVNVYDLYNEILRGTKWNARQYCDRRFTTNLIHFNYDPYTGEKINWGKVRKLLE